MYKLNKTKNAIQGTIWGVLSRMVSLIVPFIIRTIIIRRLGAEYSGLGSLFSSVLQVLSLAELGVGSAMVYAMYEPISKKNIIILSAILNYYRKLYIRIGVIILVLGIIVLPFLPYFIKGSTPNDINIYILFTIYLINTAVSYLFFSYRASILSAYQLEAENSKCLLIANVFMYFLQIVCLICFENYYLYIVWLPLSTLFFNYLRYHYVKQNFPDIKCSGIVPDNIRKSIKKNVVALFFHKIGGVTVNTLDNVVISSFLGLVFVSNYGNYFYILSAITAIITVFFQSLTAGLGNSLIVDDESKIESDFYSILYLNGVIVTVCTVCCFAMYQDFIAFWVGEQYLFDFVTMILFCVYFFIHTLRRTVITYRDAAGMWKDNMLQPIVSATLNLTLNIILIQIIGINGVLLSTIISMILVDIPWESVAFFKVHFHHLIKYLIRLVFYAFISIVSCALVYVILESISIQNRLFKLVVDFLVAVLLSSIVILIAGLLLEESKRTIKKVLGFVKIMKSK